MFARYGHTCHVCGHGGANEAGHIVSLKDQPHQRLNPDAMRPMHGSNSPCLSCNGVDGKPRCCNQEMGTKALTSVFRPALDW